MADLYLCGLILLAGVGGLETGGDTMHGDRAIGDCTFSGTGDFVLNFGDSLMNSGDFTRTVCSITFSLDLDLGGVGAPGR